VEWVITNSIVAWLLALSILTASLLSMVKVAVTYSELQHLAENSAIEAARSSFTRTDISVRDICQSLDLAPPVRLESCEISKNSVKVAISEPVYLLGKTFTLAADSHVGYGYYSQNGP
jgi:hypothetical protein